MCIELQKNVLNLGKITKLKREEEGNSWKNK